MPSTSKHLLAHHTVHRRLLFTFAVIGAASITCCLPPEAMPGGDFGRTPLLILGVIATDLLAQVQSHLTRPREAPICRSRGRPHFATSDPAEGDRALSRRS